MTNQSKTPIRFFALLGALSLAGTSGLDVSAQGGGAGKRTTSNVYSTWDSATVLGGSALVRNEHGVSGVFQTSNLPPGSAVTLWFGVFNNPAACATHPCTPDDAANPL